MAREADLTWRNILLLCGSTIAVTMSSTIFVIQAMDRSREAKVDSQLQGLQRQIDQINGRLNASHRDIHGKGPNP